jgi:hypothetical protein
VEVFLLNTTTCEIVAARLLPAVAHDMRNTTDGWMFNWKRHYKLPGAKAFKIITGENDIQGLMIFQVIEGEPLMAYLESAPENKGDSKVYDYVAGCLIAYACRLSLTHGKDWHRGFLSFQCMDEEVIRVYHHKYGAVRVNKTFMFIDPPQGTILIEKYIERNANINDDDLEVVKNLNAAANNKYNQQEPKGVSPGEEIEGNHEDEEDDRQHDQPDE